MLDRLLTDDELIRWQMAPGYKDAPGYQDWWDINYAKAYAVSKAQALTTLEAVRGRVLAGGATVFLMQDICDAIERLKEKP